MSLNPTREPIEPFKLLNDSISQVGPVYLPLLIIASPAVLFNIVQLVLPAAILPAVSFAYTLLVTPILTGIATYFIYRYLKQGTIDLPGAVNQALSQSVQLILGMILYTVAVIVGFICLIVPGIHLSVRWGLVLYAVMTENYSAVDGLKYSSQLVSGRWWPVFGSMFVAVIFLLPVLVIAGILGAVIGRSQGSAGLASVLGGIVGVLITPPLTMYYVKLYLRLQETANFQPEL